MAHNDQYASQFPDADKTEEKMGESRPAGQSRQAPDLVAGIPEEVLNGIVTILDSLDEWREQEKGKTS